MAITSTSTSTSFLTKGSQVEVSSHEGDSNDAWYSATVINAPPSTTSLNHTSSNSLVYVEYHNLLSEDGSSNRLREYANIAHVRPAPVSDTGPIDFRLNDLVDAFYRDGWWTGVITTVVDASNFAVTFQNRPDEVQFRCEDLRIHKEWIGGRWFQPQKQGDMALRTTDNQIEQATPVTSKEWPVATSTMKRKRQNLDNKASPSNDIMKDDSGKRKKHLSDGQSKGFDSEVNGMTDQASIKTENFSHEKKVETKNRRECTNDAIAAMPISWWLPKDVFGAVEGDMDVGTTDSSIDNQTEQATPIIGKQSPLATSIMEEKTQNNTDSNYETSPSYETVNADSSTNKKQPADGQSEDLGFEMTDQEKREKITEMKASTKGSKRKKGGLKKELKSLQASKKGSEVYLFRTRTQEIVAKKDATKNFPLDEKSSNVAKSDKKQPDVPSAPLTVVDQEGSEKELAKESKKESILNSSRKGELGKRRTINVNTETPAQVSEGASEDKADESLEKDSTTNPEASVGKSPDTMPDDQPIFEENQSQIMAEETNYKFVDTHNVSAYLCDPPPLHKEFKSLIVGLNTCRITHAIRESPVIYKELISKFWGTAKYDPNGAGGAGSITAVVRSVPITVSEAVIREVLLFGDEPNHPTEYPKSRVAEVLELMGYEGSYPPINKKLLHPYWRLLAHVFVMCLSGNKGGTDTLKHVQSSGMVSLVMNWDYNYSKFIFEEMVGNLKGTKKEQFLMYPRFLQMIFDAKYPDIERTVDTLDIKELGPNTFGLIKQSRKGAKVSYQSLKTLNKFGHFAEIVEAHVIHISDDDEEVSEEQADDGPFIEDLPRSPETTPIRLEPSGSSSFTALEDRDTDEQLAAILSMKDQFMQSREKGVDLDSEDIDLHALQRRVFELEQDSVVKDIRISEKSAKIMELEVSLGGLTAMLYDMKRKLEARFGKDFFDDNGRGPKEKLLIMKNSDRNVTSLDHSERFVVEVNKGYYYDKFGDPSGIVKWGYKTHNEFFS